MKTIIRTLIALICLSALLLCLVGCNNTSLHVFVFNTPDNFDSLSAEEKIDWGRKNGYLVVMRSVDSKSVVENEEKLNDFLESKTEGKELLIMDCFEHEEELHCIFRGLFFDGNQYHAESGYNTSDAQTDSVYKYDICGIEEFQGQKYLYVSNEGRLTFPDEIEDLVSTHYPPDSTSWQKLLVLAVI